MYIRSNLFTPVNSNFLLSALKVNALTVRSSLILGENPHTVAGLIMNVSNSSLCERRILSVTIFTLLYNEIG